MKRLEGLIKWRELAILKTGMTMERADKKRECTNMVYDDQA
jgi:hypothetical protein